MRRSTSQKGFSIVEIVLVVVIAGIIGFLGYTFYNNSQANKTSTADVSQSATATDVAAAPNITTTADLSKVQAVLNQTDPNSTSDVSQLDSELSNF